MLPIRCLLFCLATLLLTAGAAKAAQIVVPTQFASIQKAIDECRNGDTVFLKAGTYSERFVLHDSCSLIGEDWEKTIIKGNGRDPVVRGANQCLIKNITIEDGATGILCEAASPTIEHVIVRSNRHAGIHCLISLPDIRNCLIYGNGWTGIYCQSAYSAKNSINHCVIAENSYSGVVLAGKTEIVVQNSVIINNLEFGIMVEPTARRSRIIYNDFFNNRKAFNAYAIVNATNTNVDPGYVVGNLDRSDYLSTVQSDLRGRGSDNTDLGLISESALRQQVSDPDKDGISKPADQCPDMAEDNDGFEDDDGCPDYDNDHDGIYDTQDKCPNEAEDPDGFQDNDGCPDYDNDNDGIADSLDKCPSQPETVNDYLDTDGCPDKAPAPGSAAPAAADSGTAGKRKK